MRGEGAAAYRGPRAAPAWRAAQRTLRAAASADGLARLFADQRFDLAQPPLSLLDVFERLG
jgi:hypothetical protein